MCNSTKVLKVHTVQILYKRNLFMVWTHTFNMRLTWTNKNRFFVCLFDDSLEHEMNVWLLNALNVWIWLWSIGFGIYLFSFIRQTFPWNRCLWFIAHWSILIKFLENIFRLLNIWMIFPVPFPLHTAVHAILIRNNALVFMMLIVEYEPVYWTAFELPIKKGLKIWLDTRSQCARL